MKKLTLAVFAVFMAGSAAAQDKAADGMTEDQKTLYFLGKAVSSKIKQFDFSADEAKFIVQGFSETLAGKELKLEDTYGMKLNEYLAKKQVVVEQDQLRSASVLQDAGLFDPMMHGLMPAPQLYGTWSK